MVVRGPVAAIAGLVLSACALSTTTPLTLPMADGRAEQVSLPDGRRFVVNQQALAQSRGQVFLRITRATPPELTYSDGALAKKVATAYCAGYHRALNPVAYGVFSNPASWLFEGGCL